MNALLRWTSFIALTMAVDVVSAIVGGAIAGDAGLKAGLRMTDHLCCDICRGKGGWRYDESAPAAALTGNREGEKG